MKLNYYGKYNNNKTCFSLRNMHVKATNNNPPTEYLFLDEKRKLGIVKRVQKQISKFELTKEVLGFISN